MQQNDEPSGLFRVIDEHRIVICEGEKEECLDMIAGYGGTLEEKIWHPVTDITAWHWESAQ
ncbi:hypothetical protein [Nevskia soli]|uniref:hypothetical protein n=1 Tax=Nevskia soli TaxID=418856 RepID=UPI0015D85702|nr:hypothetical protein [Nevskia soli]